MTIAEVIRRARGRAGAWNVARDHVATAERATLYHHGTAMLRWNVADPTDTDVLDYRLGWGSVSDQNGMNTAFHELDLPRRYRRDARGGGPRVDPAAA